MISNGCFVYFSNEDNCQAESVYTALCWQIIQEEAANSRVKHATNRTLRYQMYLHQTNSEFNHKTFNDRATLYVGTLQ